MRASSPSSAPELPIARTCRTCAPDPNACSECAELVGPPNRRSGAPSLDRLAARPGTPLGTRWHRADRLWRADGLSSAEVTLGTGFGYVFSVFRGGARAARGRRPRRPAAVRPTCVQRGRPGHPPDRQGAPSHRAGDVRRAFAEGRPRSATARRDVPACRRPLSSRGRSAVPPQAVGHM
jgi:hypothetical protein